MRLYLVRHGESANNALLAGFGSEQARSPDPDLTDSGHAQARLLAAHLAGAEGDALRHPHQAPGAPDGGFGLTHLYCSLMTRSIQTARYIAEQVGLPLNAHLELFEKGGIYQVEDDGTLTGLPGPGRDYFETQFPELGLPEPLAAAGWYARPHERQDQFEARVARVVQQLAVQHGRDDVVALVVHGDFIDQFVNQVTDMNRHADNYRHQWAGNFAVHNASLTRIDFQAGARVIVYTNRLGHLPPELVTW